MINNSIIKFAYVKREVEDISLPAMTLIGLNISLKTKTMLVTSVTKFIFYIFSLNRILVGWKPELYQKGTILVVIKAVSKSPDGHFLQYVLLIRILNVTQVRHC